MSARSCWWVVVGWDGRIDVLLVKRWSAVKAVRDELHALRHTGRVAELEVYDGDGDCVYDSGGGIYHAQTGEVLTMRPPRREGRYEWVDEGEGVYRLMPDEKPEPFLVLLVAEPGRWRSGSEFFAGKRVCSECGLGGELA